MNAVPLGLVPIGYSEELYAQKLTSRYTGFFPSKVHFTTYGPEPVVKMRVTIIDSAQATEGDYWAWWDAEKDRVHFIWPRKFLVEMCFTYGAQAEVDRGRGHIVRVRIEELPDAT